MCGRFTLTVDPGQLQQQFGLAEPPPAELTPRYNIAPSQAVAVVANQPERRLELFQWGLIPSWAKDPKIGNKLINARAETLAEKPAFRSALKRRRCLVVADGFYEWKKEGSRKQPVHIHRKDGRPFAFAGLWEVWRADGQSEPLRTCTIVTTDANDLVAPIHDRMPVILPEEAYDLWLDPGEVQWQNVAGLLRPFAAEALEAAPVSLAVNNPANDAPDCVLPLAE